MLSRRKGLPGNIRRGLTLLAAMLAAALGLIVPQQAGAAPGTGDGDTTVLVAAVALAPVKSGNVGEAAGSKGTANQVWNADNDSYSVKVTPSASLATNYCVTSFLDWDRQATPPQSDHMDMRGAQSCDSAYVAQSLSQSDAGYTFRGAQKLAGCYGPVNNGANGSCSNHAYATVAIAGSNSNFNGLCLRGWSVWKGGQNHYNSGGSPVKCDE